MATTRSRLLESIREAIVVIVSILIAFSLDAWWDRRTERDTTQLLLEGLYVDFRSNADELQRWIGLHERTLRSNVSILGLLSNVDDGATMAVSDTLLASAQFSPTYQPISGTLDLAIASGTLNRIESSQLKRLLVQWSAIVDDTGDDEMRARGIMQDELIPLLRSDSDLESVFRAAIDRAVGAEGTDLSYSEASARSTSVIRSTPELRALLAQRNLSTRMALRGLERVKAAQDSILSEVAAEIGRLR